MHDEIGQNITAIQIQSMLVKKTASDDISHQAASQINELAQQIHQSTRQLLRQLRPPVLDEMSLENALKHLITEFSFHRIIFNVTFIMAYKKRRSMKRFYLHFIASSKNYLTISVNMQKPHKFTYLLSK